MADETLAAQVTQAPDGSRLWLVHNLRRTQPAKRYGPALWFTRISVVNWKGGQPVRSLDVPGDIMAEGYGPSALLAPDGNALEVQYWSELGKKSFEKILHPLDTVAGQVVQTGKPMMVHSPEEWARHKTITYPESADDPSSALFVPMRLGAHVLGVLSVQSRRAGAYGA